MEILPFAPRDSWAQKARSVERLRLRLVPLPAGRAESVVGGGVVRGERDFYAVVARAGQTLELRLEAMEDNAALEVYTPGARISWQAAQAEIVGPTLTGSGVAGRRWTGRVPVSGPYLVSIGPTRGNAVYELGVSLH